MQTINLATVIGKPEAIEIDKLKNVAREVYMRGDDGFGESAAIWNGSIDALPAVVACPSDTNEVARIVRFAADHNLKVGVRGGGHNVAGNALVHNGLTCDNLEGAEIVTADGSILDVDGSQHTDLLWALRGGSENLGIVTRFSFALHPVGPQVQLVMPVYPAEQGMDILRFATQYMQTAPNELGLIGFYGYLPEEEELPAAVRDREVFVLYGCYSGPEDSVEEITGPLRSRDGLLADLSEPLAYTELQQVLDEDYPDGMRYYWRSLYLDEISEEMLTLIHEYDPQHIFQ